MSTSRRDLFKLAGAGAAALAVGGLPADQAQGQAPEPTGATDLPLNSAPTEKNGDMYYRTLGKTGEKVSLIGLGGFHIGNPKDPAESTRIIRSAIDRGINFMDNCWDYHNGDSEVRMGNALRDGYRKKVFLMTKIDSRSKAGCAKQIDESLKRLQTDVIDLMQHHEIVRMEDPDKVFGDGGSQEAMIEAQKAGKIRYIGFTGHRDPEIHLKMLETAKRKGFRFDTVQMPLNVMDAHYRSFAHKVVPVLTQEQIGVLGMKPLGGGQILQSKTVEPIDCLHYAMSLPTSVVITGCDSMKILDQAIEAAKTFQPLSHDQIATLLEKTKTAAEDGKYEHFKTSTRYDGTHSHPEWMV